jgi:hypothetical protein
MLGQQLMLYFQISDLSRQLLPIQLWHVDVKNQELIVCVNLALDPFFYGLEGMGPVESFIIFLLEMFLYHKPQGEVDVGIIISYQYLICS